MNAQSTTVQSQGEVSQEQNADLLNAATIKVESYPLIPGKALDPKIEKLIAGNAVLVWDGYQRYWAKKLAKGKVLWDAVIGNIFTAGEKEAYKANDKLIIEVPELVPVLDAMEGMQVAGMRDGIIVGTGGEDAPPVEMIDAMLKKHDEMDGINLEISAMFRDGMVTGYPSFMLFERTWDRNMHKKLERFHPPWDSILPDPKAVRRGFADMQRYVRVALSTVDALCANYPDREKQIRAAFPMGANPDANLLGSNWTEDSRNILFNQVKSGGEQFKATGLVYHFEIVSMVNMDTKVWANPKIGKIEMLPMEWTQAEINRWKEFNPDYSLIEAKVPVCWVTAATSTGLLLENKTHWYQEGCLPASVFVPRVFNNQSFGFVEFLVGNLKGVNASRIEWLQSIRLANDNLMIAKEGAIANADTAVNEKGKAAGLILIKNEYDINSAIQFPLNRREQMAWRDLGTEFLEGIRRLSINENVMGAAQSSQETGKLVQTRISQSMTKFTPHMSALNDTKMDIVRKTLWALKYIHTEEEMVRYVDQDKNPQTGVINQETDYSWVAPAAAKIKNDLCGADFDYIAAEGDNSITAREHELTIFNEILERLARLPSIEYWPMVLMAYPNRIAQEAAKRIQANLQAQSQAPKTDNLKISLAGTPDDLLHNPMYLDILNKATGLQVSPPQQVSPQSTGPQPGNPPQAAPGGPSEAAQQQQQLQLS